MNKYLKAVICIFILAIISFSCSDEDKDDVKIQLITSDATIGGYYFVNGSRFISFTESNSTSPDLNVMKITTNGIQTIGTDRYFEATIKDLDEITINAKRVNCSDYLDAYIFKDNSEVKKGSLDPTSSTPCTTTLSLTYKYQ